MTSDRLYRRLACGALLGVSLLAALPALAQQKSVKSLGIVDHPSIIEIRKGIIEGLKAEGFDIEGNVKWEYQSAQGNPSIAAQIARKFIGDNPDVIIAIATPTAQAVAAATKTIPIVYSAVTDPAAAGLVRTLEPSGTNVTGVADPLPLDKQIALIRQVVPSAKRVGMVYNPGEINSTVVVEAFRRLLPQMGMMFVEATATRSGDVSTAARSLVGKVDVIYSNTDNTVFSAYDALLRVSQDAKIPIVSGSIDAVKRGAIAALGIDFHAVGLQTAKVAARVLRGEKPGAIPSEVSDVFELHVNKGAARRIGLELSPALVKSATTVVE
jgi:putative ABC transport system substrate-binding protein